MSELPPPTPTDVPPPGVVLPAPMVAPSADSMVARPEGVLEEPKRAHERGAQWVEFIPRKEATERYKNLGSRATKLLLETHRDEMTGLANEKMLKSRLGQFTERANKTHPEGEETDLGLLYVDVDHFKSVNDTLGHDVGDELAKIVGRALNNGTRKTDLAAIPIEREAGEEEQIADEPVSMDEISSNDVIRQHGDEFAIVVPKITPDNPRSEMSRSERLDAMAERLRESVAKEIEESEYAEEFKRLGVGISVGRAIHLSGEDGDQLLRNGDKSMLDDKANRNAGR